VGAKAISPTRRSSDDPNETKMPKRKQQADHDVDESESADDEREMYSSESGSGGDSVIYLDSDEEWKLDDNMTERQKTEVKKHVEGQHAQMQMQRKTLAEDGGLKVGRCFCPQVRHSLR
jgi:hypothetical protein